MTHARPAIVLLSGGLDSATTLAICKQEGFRPLALSFAYGQRQHVELEAAAHVARSLGAAEHRFVKLDLAALGGSALTDSTLEVPKDRNPDEVGAGVPNTYVPARNTVFLSYALAWAEVVNAFDIFLGVNAVDYSGYPDCRPEFVAAFEHMANRALAATVEGRGSMRIHAPLMTLTKADIIRRGTALGVDYALTHSCYDPVGTLACGRCDSCQLRRAGFVAAGVHDPTRYVPEGAS